MDMTKALLVYFIKYSPRILGRTELMKYIYTFEYIYYQMTKQRFTGIEFTRYLYGPNDQSVVDATVELDQEGLINIRAYDNYYGGISYNHIYVATTDDPIYGLQEDAELVACFVIDRLCNESLQGVLDYSYETPPMRVILREEKSYGIQLLGRVINMDEKEPIFKSTSSQREEARRRLKERKPLSPEYETEYYEQMIKEFDLFEDVRRRAEFVGSEIR